MVELISDLTLDSPVVDSVTLGHIGDKRTT